MWLKFEDVQKLGFTDRWVRKKVDSGNWESRSTGQRGRNGKPIREVLLESLPHELQLKWVSLNPVEPEIDSSLTTDCETAEKRLTDALMRYEPTEREAFQAEALRLEKIVRRYNAVGIKRIKNILTGKYDFSEEVLMLCRDAVCTDKTILEIELARALPPSPHTLDGWAKRLETDGLLTFIRAAPKPTGKHDKRQAVMSPEAVEWVERNFRNCPSPRHLFNKLEKQAKKHGWTIPSESYFYRKYSTMPSVVTTLIYGDGKSYQSQLAPYVPRDYSDLEALQVLCGDHSVRDISVVLPDGNLARPWLTLWLDLRTYLIWGWHLDLVPSSQTIGLAYANGCRTYGAQPLALPEADFYSYLYTDWGRDYRALDLNGRTLTFKKAAQIDGGLQIITTQRRVGLMDELGLKHLLARAYNAKEKPVERVHKDISAWEQNTFPDEYCGRDKNKPEQWRENWYRHQKLQKKFGKNIPLIIQQSPFMDFDSYRENIAGWIEHHNTTAHKRTVLNGRTIIPVEELNQMYSRVHISEEATEFLLLKAAKKKIGKNGVTMIIQGYQMQFLHTEMSEHKEQEVEIRFSDNDYSHVWVLLPATDRKPQRIVKAELVNRSGLLNPNKATLTTIAQAGKHEIKLARDYSLLNQSQMRGETTMDRVAHAQLVEMEKPEQIEIRKTGTGGATVHQMTKFDALKIVGNGKKVSTEQVEKAEIINIFRAPEKGKIKNEWEN